MAAIEEPPLEAYAVPTPAEKPSLPEQRGGAYYPEAAADLVASLSAGLITHVTAYEEPTIEAALNGGVDRVTDALIVHPLSLQASVADDLARRLVATNAAHLPWPVGS